MYKPKIVASGYYLPETIRDNNFFINNPNNPYLVFTHEDENGKPVYKEERTEITEAKIIKNTGGIKQRRVASKDETHEGMLAKAFVKTGFDPNDLEGIIIGTSSDPVDYPSLANRLQEMIGAKNISYSFHLHAACSGFTHALEVARLRVKETGGHYLVGGVETLSRITDYTERNCNLFGDGAGLVILGPSQDQSEILATAFSNDISGLRFIYKGKDGFLRMPEGPKVLVRAVSIMLDTVHKLTEKVNLGEEKIKLYIPHQANGNITRKMKEKVDPEDKGVIFNNIESFGNMASATTPVALAQAIEQERIVKGDIFVIVDMASGLKSGGAIVRK